MNETLEGLVLLFHLATDPARAARLHARACPMVNTSKTNRGVVRRLDADLTVIADLEDMGFPVKRCRCCR
jgi:hypothetical protein